MSTPALSFTELESAAKSASTAAVTTTTAEPPKTETTVPIEEAKPQFTDADVAAYRQLQDMGITPQTAQEFVQAKQNLEVIAHALQEDPKAFLEELRRSNPAIADRVMEVVSDEWYERKGKYLVNDKPNGSTTSSTTRSESVPDPRLDTLERELNALKSAKQQEDAVKMQAQVVTNYELALDGLSSKLPADLSSNVKDHIRLKAEKLAWKDDSARARINKGDFTDLPKYFAEASRRVTAEIKAAADKERTARSGVESRGSRELPPGTENTLGSTEQKPGQDPIWGNITEAEVAGAYKR